MFFKRGWKIFARPHSFMDEHVLLFKLVEADMLSVKIYGCSGARLGCCKESSSDAESSSSSESDEDNSADKEGNSEHPAVKSEYSGAGSG
ncbi:L-ascorbate oxidase-like protein [Hordeum vulgare]|nr:L-ascorbate oxidase-like protein [Hordeum vulgare]